MPPCHPTRTARQTLAESDEDVRRATAPSPRSVAAVSPWRPTQRPPVALLTVCDDGRPDGEVIRIRAERFVIGRTDGDLTVPHDALMSTRHAEITRQQVGGLWRWVLTDLQSTNGLFLRLSRTMLKDRREFLAGGGRYRFDAPDGEPDITTDHLPSEAAAAGTQRPSEVAGRPPAMTELVGGGIGNRVVLTRAEYWIGTDPACAVCRPDDPFCEPRQVRVYRTGNGWLADHPKTVNGLWVRLPQMVAERTVQFQLGEQRFKLVV